MPGTERRHSASSEDANPLPQRQLSQDGTEIIPTRMSKVTTPKPASNPLQFIKTGPADLYKAAQEQIKKVEEIKKVEKVKDDSEDWQSVSWNGVEGSTYGKNLDNWKCSRRKRQEHIIERVVEVKKLELEEHDRNRRRSKTFNEMMEERNSKGGLRKMSILSFSEEDSNDLSDLGLTSSKEKSSDRIQNGSSNHRATKAANKLEANGHNNSNGHNASGDDEGSSTPATISSPEPEEYTYERAIQSYMNFAEAKVKTTKKIPGEKTSNGGGVNFRICSMKKEPSGKIGEKMTELEQIRLRSKSTNDISGGTDAKPISKVDVLKRRSLFENAVDAADPMAVKSSDRIPKDLTKSNTVKERLLNLEKNNGETVTPVRVGNRSPTELASNIRDAITNLEKQKAVNGQNSSCGKRPTKEDAPPSISIKERLTSLEKQNVDESAVLNKAEPERDAGFKKKLETFKLTEKIQSDPVNNSFTGNGSIICSDSLQNHAKPLERSEKLDRKDQTDKNVGETTEEEPKSQQSMNHQRTIDVGQTVSSPDKEFKIACTKLVMVRGDAREDGTGEETAASCESTRNNQEVDMSAMVCDDGEMGNTNNKSVEGGENDKNVLTREPENSVRGSFGRMIVAPEFPQRRRITKTIVTHMSCLLDTEVPRPVSFDTPAKEFPDSSCCLPAAPTLPSPKPQTRVRKLTPMACGPQMYPASPLKSVCELQIIEEGDGKSDEADNGEQRKTIAVRMNPGMVRRSRNQVQEEVVGSKMSKEKEETPDMVINGEKDEEDGQDDEPTMMYTDENIEEVLGKDDDDEEEEMETVVDEVPHSDEYPVITEEVKIQKELEIFTPKESMEAFVPPLKPLEFTEKPLTVCGNYENVFITNQVAQLRIAPDSNIYSTLSFPLGSRPMIEPPKEKPPPPPLELSDEESSKPELPPKPSLRRLDSTKRIKKEIRKKRSDFLGIEGANDDSYLEPEIYVEPPPDMMTFLQEERRLEQQLYRQSICSECDSNHETAESRDSGVELDRGHVDDICWSKPDVMSEPHSRQNSETFGNTSITSEEDEILKKEREIIEVLEKEEQWRYGNKNSHSAEQNDIGEKLAVKLRQLEQEKMQLERKRAEEEDRRKTEESSRRLNEQQLLAKQQQLRQQETWNNNSIMESSSSLPSSVEQEALRFERERLHKEQEHLERCRQNLMEQQQNSEQAASHKRGNVSHWDTPSNRHSLQEAPIGVPLLDVPRHSMQDVSQPQYSSQMSSGYRYSLPDLQQRESRSIRPPPPIPPAKPMRPMTQEQWERETNIRNSRIPSADNIPLQIEASTKLRHGSSVPAINVNHGGQQMTRSTLHALSAAPRSRIISNENWMQPKRKVDASKPNYNYQHWLIQEAEHRRIFEHQQKVSQQLQSKRNPLPFNGQTSSGPYVGSPPSHHTVGLPISPPVQNQSNQKWVSPLRADKPLPDSVIQTLTQRVQSKTSLRRRTENSGSQVPNKMSPPNSDGHPSMTPSGQSQERMLSVSGKKKCSHCNEELGRGAAMIIESLRLFYHIDCFKCCVCHVQLGDGLMGTDVRVRNNKLHCHNCYSSDDENVNCVRAQKYEIEEAEVRQNFGSCDFTSEVDVPDWFKEFCAIYWDNEVKKYNILEDIFLRMIDFEIEKCELLSNIITRLKN